VKHYFASCFHAGEILVVSINDDDEYVSPSKNLGEGRKAYMDIKKAANEMKADVLTHLLEKVEEFNSHQINTIDKYIRSRNFGYKCGDGVVCIVTVEAITTLGKRALQLLSPPKQASSGRQSCSYP
jgi:hypothetical protein